MTTRAKKSIADHFPRLSVEISGRRLEGSVIELHGELGRLRDELGLSEKRFALVVSEEHDVWPVAPTPGYLLQALQRAGHLQPAAA